MMTTQFFVVLSEWYNFCVRLIELGRGGTTVWEIILKWADFILKIVNLCIIVWIFRKNFAERKSERIRDTRRETADFFIRDVILEPNLKDLDELFKGRISQLNNCFTELSSSPGVSAADGRARLEEMIDHVKRPIHDLRERIASPLIELSPHFQPLEPLFETLEDICTNALEYAFRNGGIRNASDVEPLYADKIVETHRKFSKALLQGWQDFLKVEESPTFSSGKKSFRKFFGNCFKYLGGLIDGSRDSKV